MAMTRGSASSNTRASLKSAASSSCFAHPLYVSQRERWRPARLGGRHARSEALGDLVDHRVIAEQAGAQALRAAHARRVTQTSAAAC
eukprot:6203868-Pleurochrysis_carterae.AAC.3